MTAQADADLAALSIASEAISSALTTIQAGQWSTRTPCEDWVLRDLVDHVTGGNWFSVAILGGEDAEDALGRSRDRFDVRSPTVDEARWSVADQLEAFQRPGVLAGIWNHMVGPLSGRQVLRLRMHDLIVHTWDINQSTGSGEPVPRVLAAWGLGELGDKESLAVRHFGAATAATPHNAPPEVRYLQLFGRAPLL